MEIPSPGSSHRHLPCPQMAGTRTFQRNAPIRAGHPVAELRSNPEEGERVTKAKNAAPGTRFEFSWRLARCRPLAHPLAVEIRPGHPTHAGERMWLLDETVRSISGHLDEHNPTDFRC